MIPNSQINIKPSGAGGGVPIGIPPLLRLFLKENNLVFFFCYLNKKIKIHTIQYAILALPLGGRDEVYGRHNSM